MNERLLAERGRLGELKATEPEAESVGRYFRDYFNHNARVLTRPEAGESSLKGVADAPLVLHLATQGFFLAARAQGADCP